MNAIQNVLDKFQRVRRVSNGQWMAACPICDSKKGRPVAIKEAQDGRVLIHGFCGHETGLIIDSIGLSIGDLFDKPLTHHATAISNRVSARAALDLIDEETLEIGILALDFRNKRQLSEKDWDRLALAAARIGRARDLANGL